MLDVDSDIIVQSWLNMEGFVRFFNLLDPHVKGVQFLLDEVIEVVRCVEDSVDRTHQEREEGETQELKGD